MTTKEYTTRIVHSAPTPAARKTSKATRQSAPTQTSRASVKNKIELEELRKKVEKTFNTDKTIFAMMDRASADLMKEENAAFFLKMAEVSNKYRNYAFKIAEEMAKNGTLPHLKIKKKSDYLYLLRFVDSDTVTQTYEDLTEMEGIFIADEFITDLMDAKIPIPEEILGEMLHHAAEWRDVERAEKLLKYGADPRYVKKYDGVSYTVMDILLWGHGGYDYNDYKPVLKFWRVLKKYDPTPRITQSTINAMMVDHWDGLENAEYRKMVGM